mmetsp:Transcript_274/g.947  ORF Transcript_274/g.947 Transcript_274/m.947 type:complete len:212 (-) Transcript_274:1471-2106(-)
MLSTTLPPYSRILTVETPPINWQNTQTPPGLIKPSCRNRAMASTSAAPDGFLRRASKNTSDTSESLLIMLLTASRPSDKTGMMPRMINCCLASSAPSMTQLKLPPRIDGIVKLITGQIGLYFAIIRVVSPVCENTTIQLARVWYAHETAASAKDHLCNSLRETLLMCFIHALSSFDSRALPLPEGNLSLLPSDNAEIREETNFFCLAYRDS